MKDPDQPELDDPRRREYDFQQAMAAQGQMASGTFGSHHSAILPDGNGPQGESKKSRLEAMISDAVRSAVTQITTNVAGVVQSFDNAPAKELPVTLQPDAVQQFRQQDVMQPQVAQPQAVQQQPQVIQPAGGPRAEPVFVQQPVHRTEPSHYQTPQMPEALQEQQARFGETFDLPDSTAPRDGVMPSMEHQRTPLQALHKMAMPERPVQDIRASTLVMKDTGQEAPKDAPQAAPAPQRFAPQFPVDRAAWGSREPHLDPDGKTADPTKSSRQSSDINQAAEMSEAMDHYGMVMAEFTEAVAESIRTLTRRVNDMTRAIQGEGYDIR